MKNDFFTQSELMEIYENQRTQAEREKDTALLKFYAAVDEMNADRKSNGHPAIYPIITEHLFEGDTDAE